MNTDIEKNAQYYHSERQKAKLFEDLVYKISNQNDHDSKLTANDRKFFVEQISLLTNHLNTLTYDGCVEVVADVVACMEKTSRMPESRRFQYRNLVMNDIRTEVWGLRHKKW